MEGNNIAPGSKLWGPIDYLNTEFTLPEFYLEKNIFGVKSLSML